MGTSVLKIAKLDRHLPRILQQAARRDTRTLLKHGARTVAVVVSVPTFDRLVHALTTNGKAMRPVFALSPSSAGERWQWVASVMQRDLVWILLEENLEVVGALVPVSDLVSIEAAEERASHLGADTIPAYSRQMLEERVLTENDLR